LKIPPESIPTASFEHDILNTGNEAMLRMVLKKRQEASVADTNYISASSSNPKLKIGSIIEVEYNQELSVNDAARLHKDPTQKQYRTTSIGTYIITEIKHKASNLKEYKNKFKAIPAFVNTLPAPNVPLPEAHAQRAIVIDNADPKNQGRVRVQMLWQKTKHLRGPWAQVMTPDAGTSGEVPTNRGFVFIPEVGDNVMLGFHHNNPNQPFVLGSLFNGQTGTGGQEENHLKTLKTRSGVATEINDDEKSWKQSTPDGNYLFFDGQGNATLNIPKNLNITVGDDFTVNVGGNLYTLVSKNSTETIGENKSVSVGMKKMLTVGMDYFVSVMGKMTEMVTGDKESRIEKDRQRVVNGENQIQSEKNYNVHSKTEFKGNSAEKSNLN
jgi:type VI secretion system secreted protein VgrG